MVLGCASQGVCQRLVVIGCQGLHRLLHTGDVRLAVCFAVWNCACMRCMGAHIGATHGSSRHTAHTVQRVQRVQHHTSYIQRSYRAHTSYSVIHSPSEPSVYSVTVLSICWALGERPLMTSARAPLLITYSILYGVPPPASAAGLSLIDADAD